MLPTKEEADRAISRLRYLRDPTSCDPEARDAAFALVEIFLSVARSGLPSERAYNRRQARAAARARTAELNQYADDPARRTPNDQEQ